MSLSAPGSPHIAISSPLEGALTLLSSTCHAPAWGGNSLPSPALNPLGHSQNVSPIGLIRSQLQVNGFAGTRWKSFAGRRHWVARSLVPSGEKCLPIVFQGGWAWGPAPDGRDSWPSGARSEEGCLGRWGESRGRHSSPGSSPGNLYHTSRCAKGNHFGGGCLGPGPGPDGTKLK